MAHPLTPHPSRKLARLLLTACALATLMPNLPATARPQSTRPSAPAAPAAAGGGMQPVAMPLPAINNAQLSELAAQMVILHNVPGIGIAVVDRTGVRALGVAGVRAAGTSARIEPEDPFHIGSCGKAITALVLARLAEQGKLSLTQPIGQYLPALKLDPAYQQITLLDLLHHRSGITDAGQLPFLRAGAADPPRSRAALAARILTKPPLVSPPATAPADASPAPFQYSNVGYAIAGHIAETVTGQPWETLVRDQIFTPLAITTAGFGAPGTAAAIDAPRGHSPVSAPIAPGPFADNPPGLAPAGTMYLSLRDWAKITAVFLGGGPDDYLKPDSLTLLTAPPESATGTPTDPRYAAGWGRTLTRGRPTLTHAGSNTLWFAQAYLFPDDNWGFLITINQAGPAAEKALQDIAKELVALAP